VPEQVTVRRRAKRTDSDLRGGATTRSSRAREAFQELSDREADELQRDIRAARVTSVIAKRLPALRDLRLMSVRDLEVRGLDAGLSFGRTFIPRTATVERCQFVDCSALGWTAHRTTFRDCQFTRFRVETGSATFVRSTFERCQFRNVFLGSVFFDRGVVRETTFESTRGDRVAFWNTRFEKVKLHLRCKVLALWQCDIRGLDLRDVRAEINVELTGEEDVLLPQDPTCFFVMRADLFTAVLALPEEARGEFAKDFLRSQAARPSGFECITNEKLSLFVKGRDRVETVHRRLFERRVSTPRTPPGTIPPPSIGLT